MAYTFDSVLGDRSISVIESNPEWGVFRFRVGELSPEITVVLSRSPVNDQTRYECSHHIRTPEQAGPYIQSRSWWDYPEYALHQAVNHLTSYFRQAVKAGHQPSDSWLVENSYFRSF